MWLTGISDKRICSALSAGPGTLLSMGTPPAFSPALAFPESAGHFSSHDKVESQAEALLAARRILARLKPGEDLTGELTEERIGRCSRTTHSNALRATCGSLLSGTLL